MLEVVEKYELINWTYELICDGMSDNRSVIYIF